VHTVEALQRENGELRGHLAQMMVSQQALTASVTQLTAQCARLNDRVAELLAVAQRKQRPPPTEKPSLPPPIVPGEAKQAFEKRPVTAQAG